MMDSIGKQAKAILADIKASQETRRETLRPVCVEIAKGLAQQLGPMILGHATSGYNHIVYHGIVNPSGAAVPIDLILSELAAILDCEVETNPAGKVHISWKPTDTTHRKAK